MPEAGAPQVFFPIGGSMKMRPSARITTAVNGSNPPRPMPQRIAGQEMARRGRSEAELEQRRKAVGEKIRITRRLRAETTMTWGWTAERLAMGTSGYTQTVCGLSAHDLACSQDMRICGTDPFRKKRFKPIRYRILPARKPHFKMLEMIHCELIIQDLSSLSEKLP